MIACCSFGPDGRLAKEKHKETVFIRLLAEVVADFKKENQRRAPVVSVKSCGWYLRLNQEKRAWGWTQGCLVVQAACLLPKQAVN